MDCVPPSVDSRNEGVRGSNPRVGSLKAPLSGVVVCSRAYGALFGSHPGHTVFATGPCLADQFFRGDGFGAFELVEDVAVGVERQSVGE